MSPAAQTSGTLVWRYSLTTTPRSVDSPAPSASSVDGRTPMPMTTRSASSETPLASVTCSSSIVLAVSRRWKTTPCSSWSALMNPRARARLTAGSVALEDERVETLARRVHGCGKPAGATADVAAHRYVRSPLRPSYERPTPAHALAGGDYATPLALTRPQERGASRVEPSPSPARSPRSASSALPRCPPIGGS